MSNSISKVCCFDIEMARYGAIGSQVGQQREIAKRTALFDNKAITDTIRLSLDERKALFVP